MSFLEIAVYVFHASAQKYSFTAASAMIRKDIKAMHLDDLRSMLWGRVCFGDCRPPSTADADHSGIDLNDTFSAKAGFFFHACERLFACKSTAML